MGKFNLTLDSSQISTYLGSCPLQWWYKYKEHLELSTTKPKIAADKGTLVHHLMDLYYTQRALNPEFNKLQQASTVCELFKQSQIVKTYFPKESELENFLCNRFMLYVQRYITDDFTVQVNKNEIGVEVGFSNVIYENAEIRFILEGRLDLLNLIGSNIPCWVDHKTEGRYNPLYPYKVQFKTYALATGFEYGMVNYFGMQEDKDNNLLKTNKLFRRELIHFPKPMIEEWQQKVIEVFWNIYYKLDKVNNPEFNFYQIKNDGACSGAFDANPCQFTYLCEEYNWDLKQKIKDFKYTKKEPWRPWSPKELEKV